MNPIICPQCNNYRLIVFRPVIFGKEPHSFVIRLPIYQCTDCDIKPQPVIDINEPHFAIFKQMVLDSVGPSGPPIAMSLNDLYQRDFNKPFGRYGFLGFNYDPKDYYFIPGLYREEDDGYLTPIFFEKDLLVYYNNHPDYSVLLYSFSSGSIYFKGKTILNYGFGINRSGKLFTWLGDLAGDLGNAKMARELKRFQLSNVDSDHDIASTFYLSQIPFTEDDLFPDSDNEVRVFQLKNLFDERIKTLYSINISKVNVDRLPDYYRTPILNDREQILDAYLKLDQYLIETVQKADLRNLMLNNGLSESEIRDLGSIKLLEKFAKDLLSISNTQNLFSPLFVLHDLRNLKGHFSDTSFTSRYNTCKQRLDAPLKISDYDFFVIVIQRLIALYEQLSEAANNHRVPS